MNPKAVLFDAYGTLFSTGTGSLDAARTILARNGRADIAPESFYAHWKALHRAHIDGLSKFKLEEDIFLMDLLQLYQEYGLAGSADEDVKIMLDTLGKRQAFPETATVLEALSQSYLLAVASTSDTAPLLADLDRNHLHIAHIYTSELLMAYKPRPEFYRKILADLGVPASEALFVGDSLVDDVAGPQAVGMKACWVNRKAQTASGITPDYTVTDLTGLLDILQVGERNGK